MIAINGSKEGESDRMKQSNYQHFFVKMKLCLLISRLFFCRFYCYVLEYLSSEFSSGCAFANEYDLFACINITCSNSLFIFPALLEHGMASASPVKLLNSVTQWRS